jgi:EAL domain-containing protein (putative c-di-GMP-specific phosphodiesterase class I)
MADEKTVSIEHLLLEYVQRLAKFLDGRRAVIIHLSRLRPNNRRDHHIRIAANTFETLVKQFDGHLFQLTNADIVFICKGASVAALDEAVMRVRYLFSEDPLANDFDDDGPGRFASWYDIARQYDDFLAAVRGLHEENTKRQKRLQAITGQAGGELGTKPPLNPKSLAELIDSIQRADLSNVLRRQAVCALAAEGPPKPVFREIYVSIADLAAAIMPRYDLAGDRWLFHYLTQTLDKRVLTMLKRNDDKTTSNAFSLNLNVSTLLSPIFLEFDASLRTGTRGAIVLELDKADIYSDLGAYLFARDFVKERGYRVCLDGVTELTLPFIDRERLGLDLVKIFWNPEMVGDARTERATAFRQSIERVGKARTILARCESESAIQFGQSLGVMLFQGRHIDRLLASADPDALRRMRTAGATAAPGAARM